MKTIFILCFSLWFPLTTTLAVSSEPKDTVNANFSTYLDMNSKTTDNSTNTSIRIAAKTSYFRYGIVGFDLKEAGYFREKIEFGFQVYEAASDDYFKTGTGDFPVAVYALKRKPTLPTNYNVFFNLPTDNPRGDGFVLNGTFPKILSANDGEKIGTILVKKEDKNKFVKLDVTDLVNRNIYESDSLFFFLTSDAAENGTVSLWIRSFASGTTSAPKIFLYDEQFTTVMKGGSIGYYGDTNKKDSVFIYFPPAAVAPFSVTYTDGNTPVTVTNITERKYAVAMSPTSTVTYTLTASSDANGPINVSGSATFSVEMPGATLSGTATIFSGQSTSLTVNFKGVPPFGFTYNNHTGTPVTVSGINSSTYSFPVLPGSTFTYSLVSASDKNNASIGISGTPVVTVLDIPAPVSFEPFELFQIVTDKTTAAFVGGKLQVTVAVSSGAYPGFRIFAPHKKWNLNSFERVGIEIQNLGTNPVTLSCWAVTNGWGGIGGYGIDGSKGGTTTIAIGAQATQIQYIYLHPKFKDNLHKMVNPEEINYFEILFATGTTINSKIEIKRIFVDNPIMPETYDKTGRLVVPPMEDQLPAAGKRVKQQLSDYNGTKVFHTLYLPTDWEPGKIYPVIVEYAPNIFFNGNCYSTGRVEDMMNGYGISKGEGYIWLALPFVSSNRTYNEVNAWGSPDATVNYALKAVRMVCENFGGDPAGVFVTGFSRGGIATGYIALRNDIIADTWIGFNACQHTDGDGWNGSEIGAGTRVARLKGRPVFLLDNDSFPWVTMVPAAGSPMQKENSGIGAHSAANYMDDRPSTVKLRQWFAETYSNKPGTSEISGVVTDQDGKPLADVLIESGSTHFVKTDANGLYEMKGLVRGNRNLRCSSQLITEKTTDITLVNDTVINLQVQLKEYSGLTTGESREMGLVNTIADDYLLLKADAQPVEASVLDLNGRLRISFAANERKLNVSTLESGLYLVRILSENNRVVKRFLKI